MQIPKEKLFLNSAESSKIGRLAKVSFAANGVRDISGLVSSTHHWKETFYGLEKSSLWKKISLQDQNSILKNMSDHLLREAYYIENAGMLYAAKMNVMAETQEERTFYSIMGYEEARHLQSLQPYFSAEILSGPIPGFSAHIGKIITEGDRPSNLFLIQILLEGWGLTYYQSLADTTTDNGIQDAFQKIIKDETRHHSAGMILLEQKQTINNSFLLDAFHELLEMVRIGPYTLVQEIKKKYDFSEKELKTLLQDINAVADTNRKLARLRDLTDKALGDDLMRKFEKNKVWDSYSLEEMLRPHL